MQEGIKRNDHWMFNTSTEPKKVYICGSCNEAHDFESDAESCCRPDIFEEWECPVCKESHAEKDDAAACCSGAEAELDEARRCPQCKRHHQLSSPNIDAIRIASMCTYCSPSLFTAEQRLEIERSYAGRTGNVINLDE